jgi:hypothetical protein
VRRRARFDSRMAGGWSATLTLPDYGRVARHPPIVQKTVRLLGTGDRISIAN